MMMMMMMMAHDKAQPKLRDAVCVPPSRQDQCGGTAAGIIIHSQPSVHTWRVNESRITGRLIIKPSAAFLPVWSFAPTVCVFEQNKKTTTTKKRRFHHSDRRIHNPKALITIINTKQSLQTKQRHISLQLLNKLLIFLNRNSSETVLLESPRFRDSRC